MLDCHSGGGLSAAWQLGDVRSGAGAGALIISSNADGPSRVLLLGVGPAADFDAEAARRFAGRAVREAERGLELIGDSKAEELGYRLRDLAHAYTMVGDFDSALDKLEILVSVPSFFSTWYVAADPAFDPLHDEPRFQQIMDQYAPIDDRRPAHI